MYARKRLDIGWLDLAHGLVRCCVPPDREAAARAAEAWFEDGRRGALCSLSVRSGLDQYLQALALPRGSEVLMSALTIPDMWKIVEHHGLVPVPLDVDARTLAPRIADAHAAATSRTRAVLVAHLFGTRIDLAPWAQLARERGWLLLEDCAQAFTGPEYKGEPAADLSMFSFGPIKTAAALAGGVLVVSDRELLARMRASQSEQPLQERRAFARRLLKYSGLKALSYPLSYALFVRACALAGKDHDKVIQGSVRGFAGGEFFAKIRHQPSAALCSLVARRLAAADGSRVAARVEKAERLRARLPGWLEVPGGESSLHSYWVFTVATDDPDRVVALAREAGFDATRAASLSVVPAPAGRPELEAREARALLARLVYLPVYPELGARAADELVRALGESRALPIGEARAAKVELA
jgi:perosamine synthetase